MPKIVKVPERDFVQMLKRLMEIIIEMRPVVGAYLTIFTNLSKLLSDYLQEYINEQKTIIKDTNRYINDLRKLGKVRNGRRYVLLTADVKALYKNINHEALIRALVEMLPRVRRMSTSRVFNKISDEEIIKLIEFMLKNNLINFQNITYKQLQGLIMGDNEAPPLANILLLCYELSILLPILEKGEFDHEKGTKLHFISHLYRRLIDDINWVFSVPKNMKNNDIQNIVDRFQEIYNQMCPGIEITISTSLETNEINFLDLTIMLNSAGDTITTKTFFKAFHRFKYLNYSSFHPPKVYPNFILTELTRYMTHSSTAIIFYATKNEFMERLRNNKYPEDLIIEAINSFKWDEDRRIKILTGDKNRPKNPKLRNSKILPTNGLQNYYKLKEDNERKIYKKEKAENIEITALKKDEELMMIVFIQPFHPCTQEFCTKFLKRTPGYENLTIELRAKLMAGFKNPPNLRSKIMRTKLIEPPVAALSDKEITQRLKRNMEKLDKLVKKNT